MTLVLKRMIPNSEVRWIIIESLAFENANAQHRRVIRPLKARWTPLEEWVWDTIDIESRDHNDVWIGEVISRGLKKNRYVECFNCNKQGHLKRDCKQGVPRNNAFPKNNPNRMPLPFGVCRTCDKGRHWMNECKSTRDI